MEVYAAQIDRMDQGIGRILARAREDRPARRHAGHLPRRQRRLRRGHPGGRHDRRAGRQADDRQVAHAQRRAGALRQRPRPHARPGEHLPELRHGLGQPVEHAVPPLQALDPRRRHRDAADRALAGRHRATRAAIRHAPGYLPDIMATILDVTGTPYPDDVGRPRRSSRSKASRWRRCSTRDGVERPPMFWEHEGNAAVRIGKWKLVRNYPAAVGALRHGGRPHRAARPRGAAARARAPTWRRSTRPGRSAAA